MTADDPTTCALGDWIRRQAEKGPERRALNYDEKTWNYAFFADRIERCARGLSLVMGLRPGDRIAYLGRNHPDLLTLVFAAARLGLTVVPMNWRLAPPEHEAILADAAPALLVVDGAFADTVATLSAGAVSWRPVGLDVLVQGWPTFEDLLLGRGEAISFGSDTAPLLIVYTSGTTGLAKGAVLTQDAVRWNAANSVDMHGLNSDDHILTALPLFHVGGLNIQTLPALAIGAMVRLETHFDPGGVLRIIGEDNPTLTVLVPAMMKALIDHPDFHHTDLGSLRQITTGSSIVPTGQIQTFHARGIPVTQVYGTTETAPIAVYQRAEDAFRTIGSTGGPAKHGMMRLVDEEGKEPAPGEPGEIQIRGPQVMTGYWRNAHATAEAFDGDWFRTGDIGRLDEDGMLRVEARKDDLIKSGSERIYPVEIEDLLRRVDGVDDVVVVGRADPDWGEVPVAVVKLETGAKRDAGRLLQALEGKIARFKWPKDVHFVDALPRSALGKVLRYRVRDVLDQR